MFSQVIDIHAKQVTNKKNNTSLSTGQKVGIAGGVILSAAAISGIAFLIFKKRRAAEQDRLIYGSQSHTDSKSKIRNQDDPLPTPLATGQESKIYEGIYKIIIIHPAASAQYATTYVNESTQTTYENIRGKEVDFKWASNNQLKTVATLRGQNKPVVLFCDKDNTVNRLVNYGNPIFYADSTKKWSKDIRQQIAIAACNAANFPANIVRDRSPFNDDSEGEEETTKSSEDAKA